MLSKILLCMLLTAVSMAFGQENSKLDRFQTKAACEAALRSGDFQDYKPSFLSNHREPKDDEEVRPLEERACVDLHIVGGRAYVPQPKGEMYIFKGTQVVARYDCGNDATDISYVPPAVAVVVPPPPPPASPCQCVQVVDIKLPEPEEAEVAEVPTMPYYEAINMDVTLPDIRYCETDHDGFRPDHLVLGMVDQAYCHPGGTVLNAFLGAGGGLLASRAWPAKTAPKLSKIKVPIDQGKP